KDRPDLDETTVVAALAQFDDLWKALIPAEQARIVQLLVARITVSVPSRQAAPVVEVNSFASTETIRFQKVA
ncbi:MAG: hypothetical protein ACK4IU_15860, partial [Tabrizicola flagellatus]